MHPRQRSPGNGYSHRSGPTGIGHPFYATRDRDVNFGRAHANPKPFSHHHHPQHRKGDVFMEAGRLAAEYLVSQGLLPPNAIPIKWNANNSSSFKKNFSEFRAHDVGGGDASLPVEGRPSALARLGSSVSDVASGRRSEFRDKGRRRGASFRGNGFDWGRDFRRSGSWSDRPRLSPERKDKVDDDDDDDDDVDDDDTVNKDHIEQQEGVGSENISQNDGSIGFVHKNEDGSDLNKELSSSEMELKDGSNNMDSNEMELMKVSDVNLDNSNVGGDKEMKDSACDDDIEKEKPSVSKDVSVPLTDQVSSNASSTVCTDLLTLCKSVKVPTKTRSSLTCRGLKVDPVRKSGSGKNQENVCIQRLEISGEEEPVKGYTSNDLECDKTSDLKHLDAEVNMVQSVIAADNVKDLVSGCNIEQVTSVSAQSCSDRDYVYSSNLESSPRLLEYGCSISMTEERGEKRAADADDGREDTKKLKEWLPSFVPTTKDYFLQDKAVENNSGEVEISPLGNMALSSDHTSLVSNSQFLQGRSRPFLQCSEEKQSLPSSFRTCDLNLMETSELHDNHDDDPILIYSSISELKKETEPVEIDLSISHARVSGGLSTCATGSKEIEIIDLESDSVQEGRPADNKERKTDAMFAGLEGFSNHPQNATELHDVQDGGYGLMLSELLGSDFPNCSTVPGDMNSVHNGMGLHNGPGTLGEDDSIYMTLGEIPLSFLQNWEQPPPQEFDKHF